MATVKLTKKCVVCGTESSVEVDKLSMGKYQAGEYIQKAFPELTPAQRELFFLSGICGDCWIKTISVSEDEDEE